MGVGNKLTAAECNFSHQDQIWKDYVHKEISGTQQWNSDWGFLKDEYRILVKDLTNSRRARTKKAALTSHESTPKEEQVPLKLPPLQAPKQDHSNPFPLVTSKEIGWRSERRYNLEVYGRWGRPKYSIIKQLKWPIDAVP